MHLLCDPLPDARDRALLIVIGVGNPWRRDDGAGLAVARLLRGSLPTSVEVLERQGEPAGLIHAWDGTDALWLVDAVSSGATPATVHRVDGSEQALPAGLFRRSTHHLGLADAVELARALGRLPGQVVLYGIEGASFEAGEGLTPEVEAATARVADLVRAEIGGGD